MSDALRRLAGAGVRLGVFTDAPARAGRRRHPPARCRASGRADRGRCRVRSTGCARSSAPRRQWPSTLAELVARSRRRRPTALVESRSDGTPVTSQTASSTLSSSGSTGSRSSSNGSTSGSSPARGSPRLPGATRSQRVAERARLRGARSVPAGPPPRSGSTDVSPRAGTPFRRARPAYSSPAASRRMSSGSATRNGSRRGAHTLPPLTVSLQIVPLQ